MELDKWFWIIPTLIVVIPLSIAIYYGIRAYSDPAYKHMFMTTLYQLYSSLGFILLPLIYIFKRLGHSLLYLFPLHRINAFSNKFGTNLDGNDAWRSKNLLTTFIISFVVIFGILITNVFALKKESVPIGGWDMPLPKADSFGEWGSVLAFSMLAIIVLYTFYIFHKGKEDKSKPENIFPSEKSFREQASWTLKRSASFVKSLIALALILGLLIGMLFYAMRSPEEADLIASVLMIFTGIVILTITYFAVKDLKVIQKLMQNKVLQLLFHLVFLIPCVIIEVVNYIYQEIKHTPQTIYNILILEILFVACYFVIPIIQKKLYTWIPFRDDDTNVKKQELKALYLEKLKLEKQIKEERNRLDGYPELNNKIFLDKVRNDNLILTEKETELDSLIISYICTGCNKGIVDPITFKQTNMDKLSEVKNLLKGGDGILQKIARYGSRLIDLNDKEVALKESISKGEGGLNSKVLMMKPTYLGKKVMIANYKDLRVGGKLVVDDIRYNYALSCWFYLHSNAPNFYKDKYYSIMNYSDKPNISYNPVKNKLRISVTTGQNNYNAVHDFKDIKLQKWNNLVINYVNGILDVFLDAKLVGSFPQTIPHNKSDIITIGYGSAGNGLNGGICNVVFYNNRLRKKRIEFNYEYLKNKNPPIL